MPHSVSFAKAFEEGKRNLTANFWPYILIIVILGILESIGTGPAFGGFNIEHSPEGFSANKGFLAFVIAVFVKPVFDYSAKLIFVRGNRGEEVDVKHIVEGFESKDLYIDIVLTHIILVIMIILGFVALILPGIYILCRTILAPYLVMDKDLAPRQAISASWELMRDFWPQVILLGIASIVMFVVGLCLFIVGLLPAFAMIKAMFASFYQQVIDVHDEEFLRSFDIEP